MKKISSNRPFRSASGGRMLMSLAVATTNTGAVFFLHPGQEGSEDPARRSPIGIGRTRTACEGFVQFIDEEDDWGIDSAVFSALRRLASERPTIEPS